ncbi:MAG: copper transporter, partial [Actinomycetota bacterium]|nr:copper transporter [Actinomycetota bacterium]
MVDFRYHLVTIISIFLALAVGIVVGTTALNGPVLNGLRDRNAGLIGEKRALES